MATAWLGRVRLEGRPVPGMTGEEAHAFAVQIAREFRADRLPAPTFAAGVADDGAGPVVWLDVLVGGTHIARLYDPADFEALKARARHSRAAECN